MKQLALIASIVSLPCLFLPVQSQAAASPPEIVAQAESEELAAYIETGYQKYLRDFIHVYLGYNLCKYSFVDEKTLNSLADDVLRHMTKRAEEMIRARHDSPSALSPAAVHYAAQFAVLTSVGMASTMITEELSPRYADIAVACESTAAENRRRYDALQAFERP